MSPLLSAATPTLRVSWPGYRQCPPHSLVHEEVGELPSLHLPTLIFSPQRRNKAPMADEPTGTHRGISSVEGGPVSPWE